MEVLIQNLYDITWQQMIMWVIGGVLIYLAIVKEMEPTLLLPMGFGAILVNLPNSGAAAVIEHLFEIGINQHELFPLLLFIGIGAMIDFQPLLTNPKLMILVRRHSLVSSLPCAWLPCSASSSMMLLPLPSSAQPTAPPQFSFPRCSSPTIPLPLW